MGNHPSNIIQQKDLDVSKICTVCHGDHIYSGDDGHFCTDCNTKVAVINKNELLRSVISQNTAKESAVCVL